MSKNSKNSEDSGEWQPVRKPTPQKKSASFPKAEVARKNSTGSWLSAIEQPPVKTGVLDAAIQPPLDRRYRHYVGAVALNLQDVLRENKAHFREAPHHGFKAHPLLPQRLSGRHPDASLMKRSEKHCPIGPNSPLVPQAALFSLKRQSDGVPTSGSLRYSWLESGHVVHGRFTYKRVFCVQVRHHTKLEAFHEIYRPVYCINFICDGQEPWDLRLIALLHTEIPFLEAAAQPFSRKTDAFAGMPVIDHNNRVLLDERVIRRAAFHYSQFQRSLPQEQLYASDFISDPLVRQAQFLISRSHLPEFLYDEARDCFHYQPSFNSLSEDSKELAKGEVC